jgi:hypothetical protein
MRVKDTILAEDFVACAPSERSDFTSASRTDGMDLAQTLMDQTVGHGRTITFSRVGGPATTDDASAPGDHVLIVIKEMDGSRQMQYGVPTTNTQHKQLSDSDWIRVIREMADELDSKQPG